MHHLICAKPVAKATTSHQVHATPVLKWAAWTAPQQLSVLNALMVIFYQETAVFAARILSQHAASAPTQQSAHNAIQTFTSILPNSALPVP